MHAKSMAHDRSDFESYTLEYDFCHRVKQYWKTGKSDALTRGDLKKLKRMEINISLSHITNLLNATVFSVFWYGFTPDFSPHRELVFDVKKKNGDSR